MTASNITLARIFRLICWRDMPNTTRRPRSTASITIRRRKLVRRLGDAAGHSMNRSLHAPLHFSDSSSRSQYLGSKELQMDSQSPQVLPWRCLARCPKVHRIYAEQGKSNAAPQQLTNELFGREAKLYARLPPEVEEGRRTGRLERFSPEFYDPELDLYPRRVAVLEFEPDEEAEFAAELGR